MSRTAFYRQASGELERARRAMLPISLIAIELDDFHVLSESFGQPATGEILKVVGNTLREKCRPYDCIGRVSEDEFLIALPGVFGPDAEKIAERILSGFKAARLEVGAGSEFVLGGSAGVASASRINSSAELEPLIEQAREEYSGALAVASDGMPIEVPLPD